MKEKNREESRTKDEVWLKGPPPTEGCTLIDVQIILCQVKLRVRERTGGRLPEASMDLKEA
jgi:hypothetical protein